MVPWQLTLREFASQRAFVVYEAGAGSPVTGLRWTHQRSGGCGEMTFTLLMPFDAVPFKHFADVALELDGLPRWRGYVEDISPALAIPETVRVTCRGYSAELDATTLSWAFARTVLRAVADTGELAGIVLFCVQQFPLIAARPEPGPNFLPPHPICDRIDIDQSVYRPRELVWRTESVRRIIAQCAVLAGNFEWGVDADRTFYFKRPEPLPEKTASYTANVIEGRWIRVFETPPDNVLAAKGRYGNDVYRRPALDGATLPVSVTAVIGDRVVGASLRETAAGLRNVAYVYPSPPRGNTAQPAPAGPPLRVEDAASISEFGRRRIVRMNTPGLTASDAPRLAQERLRLLARPQLRGTLTLDGWEQPVPARGVVQIIPASATNQSIATIEARYERILATEQSIDNDRLITTLSIGMEGGDAEGAGQEFRDQVTLFHDRTAEELTVFDIQETLPIPEDEWIVPESLS